MSASSSPIWIDQLKEHIGEEVRFGAWVHRIRKVSNRLAFILFKDKSGIVQGVVSGSRIGWML